MPKRARVALRSAALSGRNRSTSTPGGTTVTGSGCPAACSASRAAYSPADTTWRAPRSTAPSAWRVPGSRPGTVTSAPWITTSYGSRNDGPTSPSGTAGSRTTSEAPISSAKALIRLTIIGCGSRTGSRTRSTRNGCAASNSAAPGYGLVSTANDSGGRRRHHSQSNDWMPPIFGGKSFVTNRCLHAVEPTDPSRVPAAPDSSPSRSLAHRACSARITSSHVPVPSQCRCRSGVGAIADDCRARRVRCGAASEGRGRRCTSAHAAATASRRRHRGGRAHRPTPARRLGDVAPSSPSGRRWRRPSRTVGGHTSWQSSQP